ncbi:hypothetical protein EJ05DRAFT_539187 [Pseudovirgaria hyperparasitica]|uniref:Uncharacterized protein n=1 Tax=Pseudovirgaria hyperparasitica TaxID=470096 RepID=A0A6A6W6C8_9PEZI|nr:uncharacterized protein EJ05DRAFT_539187 [Pseudovirgaria hyperparasitica]KAF2757117.1 hypothetical protein EJ05DRAFT_539187 [Pseudovirgaria hyperparasitica]
MAYIIRLLCLSPKEDDDLMGITIALQTHHLNPMSRDISPSSPGLHSIDDTVKTKQTQHSRSLSTGPDSREDTAHEGLVEDHQSLTKANIQTSNRETRESDQQLVASQHFRTHQNTREPTRTPSQNQSEEKGKTSPVNTIYQSTETSRHTGKQNTRSSMPQSSSSSGSSGSSSSSQYPLPYAPFPFPIPPGQGQGQQGGQGR